MTVDQTSWQTSLEGKLETLVFVPNVWFEVRTPKVACSYLGKKQGTIYWKIRKRKHTAVQKVIPVLPPAFHPKFRACSMVALEPRRCAFCLFAYYGCVDVWVHEWRYLFESDDKEISSSVSHLEEIYINLLKQPKNPMSLKSSSLQETLRQGRRTSGIGERLGQACGFRGLAFELLRPLRFSSFEKPKDAQPQMCGCLALQTRTIQSSFKLLGPRAISGRGLFLIFCIFCSFLIRYSNVFYVIARNQLNVRYSMGD